MTITDTLNRRVLAFEHLAALPDGPQKKFYLIKNYSDLLPANRREFSCAELAAIIRPKLQTSHSTTQ
jgi:hypothetical protein